MANENVERRARQLSGLEPGPSAEAVTQGLPLREACAHYCPEAARRLAEAKAAFEPWRGVYLARAIDGDPVPAGAAPPPGPWALALYTEFFGKLAAGELQATYRPERPRDDWQREMIPASLWAMLRDDIVRARALRHPWVPHWERSQLFYGSSHPSKATRRFDSILVFPRGMAPEAPRAAGGALRSPPAAAPQRMPVAELRRWLEASGARSWNEAWKMAQGKFGDRVSSEMVRTEWAELKQGGRLGSARERGRPRRGA
jgi:hypothetical protein